MIIQEQLPMVKIASMNDTHLEEIILVNRLDSAAREGDIDALSTILQELQEHTMEHFAAEEKMMQETGFKAYAMHKGEHDRHLRELSALRNYFAKNKDTNALIAYIDGNLVKWLIHHIETMDTVTAQFLSERGY